MDVGEKSDQKLDIYPHWMSVHACEKNEFTVDEKCHNLMGWLKLSDMTTVQELKAIINTSGEQSK